MDSSTPCSTMMSYCPISTNKKVQHLLDEMLEGLPEEQQPPIHTRQHDLTHGAFKFPAMSLFQIKSQSLYNLLKGGLNTNTQKYFSNNPPTKRG